MKRSLTCAALVLFFGSAFAAQREEEIPVKNWSVPSAEPLRIGSNAAISSNPSFIPGAPCRAVDTRDINPGALGGGIMADNSTRSFALRTATNCDAIPTSVKAYSVNIAVFGSAPGPTDDFLMEYPAGSPQPNVANLNFVGGQTLSNAAIVPAGTNASIDIYVYRSTHVIIDVNGYFIEPVVKSVSAGAGLSENASSGDVTLSIAPLGVVASMFAANAVTTGAIQDGAVTDAKVGTLSTAGKGANSATTATPSNGANTIVARDGAGGFSAGARTLSGQVDQTSNGGFLARGTVGSGTIP